LRRPSAVTPPASPPGAARPPASGSAAPLTARNVPVDVAGRKAAPFSFDARAVVREGAKQREQDAKVSMADGVITVTVRFDRGAETVLSTIPFSSLTSVTYSKGKQPLEATPGGPKQALRIDVAIGFFKGDRHWISLRTNDTYLILRVDSDEVATVIAAIEDRTGRMVERVSD